MKCLHRKATEFTCESSADSCLKFRLFLKKKFPGYVSYNYGKQYMVSITCSCHFLKMIHICSRDVSLHTIHLVFDVQTTFDATWFLNVQFKGTVCWNALSLRNHVCKTYDHVILDFEKRQYFHRSMAFLVLFLPHRTSFSLDPLLISNANSDV